MIGRSDGRSYIRDPHTGKTVYVNQLVAAAAGYDPRKIFDPDYQVHHVDGNKWRDSLTNVALLSEEKHRGIHALKRAKGLE